jgi:heme-degrading monooxygenase HmoA
VIGLLDASRPSAGGTVISRHWRGVSKRERAEAYIAHLQTETFPQLMRIPGFVRASILKRGVDRGIEFQIVTVWKSLQAIHAFAGQDLEAAVVPAVVRDMMVEFDERVRHYEVVHLTDASA